MLKTLKWATGVAARPAGATIAETWYRTYAANAAAYPNHDGVWHAPPLPWPRTESGFFLSLVLAGVPTLVMLLNYVDPIEKRRRP